LYKTTFVVVMSDSDAAEPTEQHIKKFKKKMLPKDGVIMITGRSDSGKSVLIRDLMRLYRKDFDMVVVFSGSKSTCKTLLRHVPGICIYYGWDSKKFEDIFDEAEMMVELGRKKRILVVADDLAYMSKIINNDKTIARMFFNGRHAGLLFMLSVQYPKVLNVDFRGQIRMAFICHEKNPNIREKVYDAFNPCFYTFADFDRVMVQCTKNFEVFVCSNMNNKSNKITDNVFWYKAKFPTPKFKMCKHNKKLWKRNKEKFDEYFFLNARLAEKIQKRRDKKKGKQEKKDPRKGHLKGVEIVKDGKKKRKPKRSETYPYAPLKKKKRRKQK
jgi:hypothetical protein